jgi:uncharacterized protein (TIGR04255 family)
MPVPLPTKLKKDPLVDAVFEIRLSSSMPVSSIVPGILAAKLKTIPQIERLPASDLPSQIRALTPALQFQPLIRIHWNDSFLVLVGDVSLGLACKMPYPGWHSFKSHILELAKLLNESGLIEQIERYSLKYAGVVDGQNPAEQIARIKIDLKLGEYSLKAEPFSVRIEMQRDDFLHIVNLAAPATVALLTGGSQRTGLLIDIDGIRDYKTKNLSEFIGELPDRIETLHTRNKELFFGLLTDETLAYLEPSYEPISG